MRPFGLEDGLTFVGVDGERLFTNDVAAGFHRLDDVAVMSPVDRGNYDLVHLLLLDHGGKFRRLTARRFGVPFRVSGELAQSGDGPGHPRAVDVTKAHQFAPSA